MLPTECLFFFAMAAETRPTGKWFSGSTTRDGVRELLSGMVAGFTCKFVEYPLDTVKVLLQTEASIKGPWQAIQYVHQHRGLLSLYQGLPSPLVGSMVECSVLFSVFGAINSAIGAEDHSLNSKVPLWKVVLSGGCSGMCSAFVLTPVELIKCRLQVQQGANRQYSGPIDCLVKSAREGGVTGLWKGNVSCLCREIPGNAMWFLAYDIVMRQVQRRYNIMDREDVPLKWSAVGGALAGVMYWLVPYPADTVKSKIQTDPQYRGMGVVQVLKRVAAQEGFKGLYRGCALTCARAAPSNALIFYFHALANNWLLKY